MTSKLICETTNDNIYDLFLKLFLISIRFAALSCPIMSYQLIKMLFTNIREFMMTSNEFESSTRDEHKIVLSLRNFLTHGLGSRIIVTMSDLDLSVSLQVQFSITLSLSNIRLLFLHLLQAVTNGRELTSVLTKIFPTESWNEDKENSSLKELSNEDFIRTYKQLKLMRNINDRIVIKEVTKLMIQIDNENELEQEDFNEFMSEEFKKSIENHQTTSAQLAQNVIRILSKLCELDNSCELTETDQNSITMKCLNFSLDTLTQLFEQRVFTENDQTVIKFNLIELTILCFRNLVNRDTKSIENEIKKLFHLLELSDDNRMTCGLILITFTALNNGCVKNSSDKSECMKLFTLCHHVVLRQMEILSKDKEIIHLLQLHLLRIIKTLKTLSKTEIEKVKQRRKFHFNKKSHHSNEKSDFCVFEKILIESLPLTRKFSDVRLILNNFRHFGICCCNVTIDTIKIFFGPSTVPIDFLKLIDIEMMKVIFNGKNCWSCVEKFNQENFKMELFQLHIYEINRRQGFELRTFLHYLKNIQQHFDMNFLEQFLTLVAIPMFQQNLKKFNTNPDENSESKIIATQMLAIISESLSKMSLTSQFFTRNFIKNLQDSTLIPTMAENSCQLIKIAYENLKSIEDEKERELIEESLNRILFSNVLFLTRELMEIYNQLNLPKDVPLTTVSQTSDKSETNDFEILDEKFVAIKEILSDMDVLLLNTFHWNILSEMIALDPDFQKEFVVNIYNNFSGNILFTIGYNALNTMLLKREGKSQEIQPILINSQVSNNNDYEEDQEVIERCEFLHSILVKIEQNKYHEVLRNYEDFYEIVEPFSSTLKSNETCCLFKIQKKPMKFITIVHRDTFLQNDILETFNNPKNSKVEDLRMIPSESWLNELNHLWSGISEAKDKIYEIVTKFRFQPEEELRFIHRYNLIREITEKCGLKYFSSIARDCFDICWRLSDNISFSE